MKRKELIEELDMIQYNIETVEKQIMQSPGSYYKNFNHMVEWNHLIEIRTKALAYWKRRFNRTLLKLGYKL